ncbi:HD-domain/PDEase-like protein [Backusella circina FSU 941]|nr:HD-domain/PDEase-like protein [Backusella circina FSU 941]
MSRNGIVNTYKTTELSVPSYNRHKVINDPIHGHITLDDRTIEFIDTVQFQRLRDLKQLGSTYFVFPGATHNRFEHSIGVSYLSGTLVERFAKDQPELDINPNEIECVKLAGLCHDLGHGPFSHVFDNQFMPMVRPELNWTHEQASEMMLEYLVDENNIDIDAESIHFIKDLIAGTPRSSSQSEEKKFLFDIVANKKNSVDVDKFDYIERDTYNLGLRSSYDAKRLLVYSRVVNNEICYHHKEVYNLYEMFHTRYSLFQRIYTHRVSKCVELMLTDALRAADNYMKISESVDRPEEYLHMTDDLIRSIERSKCPELEESRHIIKRLRTRDLYKFVDEFLIPPELRDRLNKNTIKAQDIINHQSNGDNLTQDDVIVIFTKLNYAMNDKNPVDSIRFFSKYNSQESFTIPKEQVSYMIPANFQDVLIRIFTRNIDKMQSAQKAFRKYLHEIIGLSNVDLDPTVTVPSDYDTIAFAKRRRNSEDSTFNKK